METETILTDLQSLPPTAANVQKYYWEKVLPNTSVAGKTDTAPIEFTIEGRDDSFIDAKNIQVIIGFRIRKQVAGALQDLAAAVVGPPAVAADSAAPYCGFLYTMFSDIHVDLQHKPLYKAWDYYQQIAYFQLLFYAPKEHKATILKNALWYRDAADGHQDILNDEVQAPGEYRRVREVGLSRISKLQGRLLVDCFNTNRPIPENMNISLRFFPHEAQKCIIAAANLNLVIVMSEMYLLVPRIVPKPSLLKHPARIPYVNTQVIRMLLPTGQQHFGPRPIVISEHLPRRCTIFILSEAQLTGGHTVSRIYFQNWLIDNVLLTVNGEHLPYYGGYKIDSFADKRYTELYDALFTQLSTPNAIDVNYDDFSAGFVVFPFDLTQRNLSSNFYPNKKSGAVELSIHFSAVTDRNLVVLALLEYERVIHINKNKEWEDKPAF